MDGLRLAASEPHGHMPMQRGALPKPRPPANGQRPSRLAARVGSRVTARRNVTYFVAVQASDPLEWAWLSG
jgi:hypothetical protein